MENQTSPRGISSSAWGVIGIVAAVAGLLVICAMVVLAFGVDVGGVL